MINFKLLDIQISAVNSWSFYIIVILDSFLKGIKSIASGTSHLHAHLLNYLSICFVCFCDDLILIHYFLVTTHAYHIAQTSVWGVSYIIYCQNWHPLFRNNFHRQFEFKTHCLLLQCMQLLIISFCKTFTSCFAGNQVKSLVK